MKEPRVLGTAKQLSMQHVCVCVFVLILVHIMHIIIMYIL